MDLKSFNKTRFGNYIEYSTDKYNLRKIDKLIKKYVQTTKGKKVLDIGCADGSFAKHLKSNGLICYGLDISKKAIANAKRNGIIAKVHDVDKKLPYKNDQFDIILLTEVMEHVFDTNFLVKDAYRILKKKVKRNL